MDTFKQLQKINVQTLSQTITDQHRNFIVNTINDSCLHLAVFTGEYPWHFHPESDELFMLIEGELLIDLQDQETVVLRQNDIFTIPAGVVHRTRALRRTVNLCFERSTTTTEFVESLSPEELNVLINVHQKVHSADDVAG